MSSSLFLFLLSRAILDTNRLSNLLLLSWFVDNIFYPSFSYSSLFISFPFYFFNKDSVLAWFSFPQDTFEGVIKRKCNRRTSLPRFPNNNGFSLSSFFLSLISFLWIGAQFPQEKFLSYGRILTLHYYFLLMCILISSLFTSFR